ncbi:MAG: STAS domain-containing protein [Methanospirillum sp.]|uniref:STAS domain-containing protein n=1 Tax=Methanospirillum sp. TaxID=45200 RepID=UPI00236BB4BE|nr:STAS domain-containing protein [Methanospirillum sp.]MDD1729921.1 STAS domain-containing protein [Methanospirillum sp.]
MLVKIDKLGNITIGTTGRRIEHNNAQEYEKELIEIPIGINQALLLDLSDTEYLSSAGLRVFLLLGKKISRTGGKFGLCCIRPPVMDIIKTGGFYRIFRIYPTREDGILDILSPEDN